MNKIPEILVNSGFPVDQNGALTELDIPNVVTTLNAPTTINFMGTTLNWIPSTTAALQHITADNVTTIPDKMFAGYSNLESASFASVVNLNYSGTYAGAFYNCTNLTSINFPALASITATGAANYAGAFYNCALTSVTLENLTTIIEYGYTNDTGTFALCSGLVTVNLPKLSSITRTAGNNSCGTFNKCTSLQSVTFGSEGNPVTAIDNQTFLNCTQTGLTITVYTQGGAALAGEPWGATNADTDIIYEVA